MAPHAAFPAVVQPIALPTAPSATGLYMPIHPRSKRIFSMEVSLFVRFDGLLLEGPKCFPFFRKAPLEELDQVEAQPVYDSAQDSHAEVDAVTHEQYQQAEQHP